MLYYLSQFTDNFSFLNIFNYITFRTGAAIFTSFLLTLLIGPKVVTKLRSYKIQQIERQYGPAARQQLYLVAYFYHRYAWYCRCNGRLYQTCKKEPGGDEIFY